MRQHARRNAENAVNLAKQRAHAFDEAVAKQQAGLAVGAGATDEQKKEAAAATEGPSLANFDSKHPQASTRLFSVCPCANVLARQSILRK
jgi:hypothetical protein